MIETKMDAYPNFNYIGALIEVMQRKKVDEKAISDLFKCVNSTLSINNKNTFIFQARFEFENKEFCSTGEPSVKKKEAKRLAAKNCLINFLSYLRQDNPLLPLEEYGLTEADLNNSKVQIKSKPENKLDNPTRNPFLEKSVQSYNLNSSFSSKENSENRIQNYDEFEKNDIVLPKLFNSMSLNENRKMNGGKSLKDDLNELNRISKLNNKSSLNFSEDVLNKCFDDFKSDSLNSSISPINQNFNSSNLSKKPIHDNNITRTKEAINYLSDNRKIIKEIFDENLDKGDLLEKACKRLPKLRLEPIAHQEKVWLKLFYINDDYNVQLFIAYDEFSSIQNPFKKVSEKMYYIIKLAIDIY